MTRGQSTISTIAEGTRFGTLVVQHRATTKRSGRSQPAMYVVDCDCGVEKSVRGSDLRRGLTTSCRPGGCPGVPRSEAELAKADAAFEQEQEWVRRNGSIVPGEFCSYHGIKEPADAFDDLEPGLTYNDKEPWCKRANDMAWFAYESDYARLGNRAILAQGKRHMAPPPMLSRESEEGILAALEADRRRSRSGLGRDDDDNMPGGPDEHQATDAPDEYQATGDVLINNDRYFQAVVERTRGEGLGRYKSGKPRYSEENWGKWIPFSVRVYD